MDPSLVHTCCMLRLEIWGSREVVLDPTVCLAGPLSHFLLSFAEVADKRAVHPVAEFLVHMAPDDFLDYIADVVISHSACPPSGPLDLSGFRFPLRHLPPCDS